MSLLTRNYQDTLPAASIWPSLCLRLDLGDADDSIASWGPQRRRFTRLRELTGRWYVGAAATLGAVLPPELVQLCTLRQVALLNVRLAAVPAWLRALPSLQQVTLRDTGLTCLQTGWAT